MGCGCFDSCGGGKIHGCIWKPEGQPKAIVQILHGVAEHVKRYDHYAQWLNEQGYLVVAADHMGHGGSIGEVNIRGYFNDGWFAVAQDAWTLLCSTMADYPGVPYYLFGHSMGSFLARTLLAKHPDSGIAGCVICGTAWQPASLLTVALPLCKALCSRGGDRKESPFLQKLMFGSYNQKVEHVRTENDWLSRDDRVVDDYNADPLCGFTCTAGLYRDMLLGISYVQKEESLRAMNTATPILFIAGSADPVGAYGKGVTQAAEEFKKAGMTDVKLKLYPMCRHEILNEINNNQVYADIFAWFESKREA